MSTPIAYVRFEICISDKESSYNADTKVEQYARFPVPVNVAPQLLATLLSSYAAIALQEYNNKLLEAEAVMVDPDLLGLESNSVQES